MAWLRRFLVILIGFTGGLTGAQLPEFAQQYRQRLGGALDELRQVVADFDADAARNGLTREEALATYGRSPEPFLRDRGVTMAGVIRRFESLSEQRARLELASPLTRPVVVLRAPDERVMEGAWADFEPAVPVTYAGIVWAAIGLLTFGIAGWLVAKLLGLFASALRRRAPPAGGRTTWQGG
jgi:Protein of unknown function (DUF2937)